MKAVIIVTSILLASTLVAVAADVAEEATTVDAKNAESSVSVETPVEEVIPSQKAGDAELKTDSDASKTGLVEADKVKRSSETELTEKDGEFKTAKENSDELDQKSAYELKDAASVEGEKTGEAEEKVASLEVSGDKSGQVADYEKSGAVSEANLESKDAEVKSQERASPVESVEDKSPSIEDAPEVGLKMDLLSGHRRMLSDPIIDAKGRSSDLVQRLSSPLSKNLGALDEIDSRSGANDVNLLTRLSNPTLLYRPALMTVNNPSNQLYNKISNPESYNPMLSQFRNQDQLTASPASNAYPYVPPSQLFQKPFDYLSFEKIRERSENLKTLLPSNFYKPYDPGYNNYDPYRYARTRRFIPDKKQLPGFQLNNNIY